MLSFDPKDIARYVDAHTTPESELFTALAQRTVAETPDPEMLVGPVEGMFLKLLVRAMGARRVLEIGTFTGYSALMMAEGLGDDGEVITCDVNPRTTRIAEAHWAKSPHGKNIRLVLGNALETLSAIEGPFDLVFIDADKENYVRYWEQCIPKVRTGGIILADNVLWSGRVLQPREPVEHAIAAFNRHVAADTRVEIVMLTIRDGITMACKL